MNLKRLPSSRIWRKTQQFNPMLVVEIIKTDRDQLRAWLENLGYSVIPGGMNFDAIHKDDKCMADIKVASPNPA